MKTMKGVIGVAAMVLAATAPALAGEPQFGLQGTVALPVGALKTAVDSNVGFGVGGNVAFDLTQGNMVRARVDSLWFAEGTGPNGLDLKLNDLSIGVDYMYFFAEQPQGFFVSGGIAAHRWASDTSIGGLSGSSAVTKFGAAGGVGYFANDVFGFEVRYVAAYAGGNLPSTLSRIEGSLLFRF